MKTTDWKFDFSSLPRWDNRSRIPYVYDRFFEIPQSDTLCCVYAIAEVSMCNYEGFLAILRHKENPELVLNIAEGFQFCDNISVSADGNLIFLRPSIYYRDTNTLKRPILIIDLGKYAFSYFATDDLNPCYKVAEINKNVFKIEADERQRKSGKRLNVLSGKTVRINRLKWHGLSELPSLPEMLF